MRTPGSRPRPPPPAERLRPLRVLHIVGNAIVGGVECWVERLLEHLPRDRFTSTVLCPFEGPLVPRLRRLGIEVFVTPMPDDPPWSTIHGVAALARERGVGLVHAHLANAHVLAGLVGRLVQRPVLFTVHGRQLTLTDLEVHHAAGTHLSTVCRASHLHALGVGAAPKRLYLEPNGVDTAAFVPRPRADSLRASLPVPPEAPLVGFVGRLSPEKGPEVFLRALPSILARVPAAHAVICGEGPLEAALRAQGHRSRLARRVHFLGACDPMPRLYPALDLLVSSSFSEAMPLAVMEAMACALPVVATRVGGVPELVAHGHTGWLVAPGDAEELAARAAALLADGALARRFGEAGRERVQQHFDLARLVARHAALYGQLTALPTPPPAQALAARRETGGTPAAAAANHPSIVSTASGARATPVAAHSNGATLPAPAEEPIPAREDSASHG
jgi:glycosyltransferase involved in cell wall biosynthesis